MPTSHRKYAEWTPERLVTWASQTGKATAEVVESILSRKAYAEHGFRSCMGIIFLGKRFGKERLEAACERAMFIKGVSYASIKSILNNNLDQKPLPKQQELLTVTHDNIRGTDKKRNPMLTQPTIEKLKVMKLTAMAQAFTEQMQHPDMASLTFEERFGLLVDHQMTELENRRMQNRLRTDKLRLSASIEDLDFKEARGMNRSQVMSLAQNQWVRSHQNILITGPTGAGKSYLACALAQKACRDGHTTLYQRLPRLLQDISIARHDGRYQKLMAQIAKCEVLVLDDLLISPLLQDDQRELLEIVEERYDRKATIVTSQLPIKAWHDAMQDPTHWLMLFWIDWYTMPTRSS